MSFLLNLKFGVSVLPPGSSVPMRIKVPILGFLKTTVVRHINHLVSTECSVKAKLYITFKGKKTVGLGDTCLLFLFFPLLVSVAFVGLGL